MKMIKKQMTILALALFALLSLSACGKSAEETATAIAQGNIDVLYRGIYDPDYLKMVNSNEDEAEKDYLEGLEMEAEYFANYWGIVDTSYGEEYSDLSEELREDIVELYDEIYSHSKYEIQPAVEESKGRFAMKVTIEPIDIMEQAYNLYDSYEPLNIFAEKYAAVDINSMTEEEYMDYTNEYGEIIVQLVRDQLPNLGYKEAETMTLYVITVNNLQQINSNDLGTFDNHVIYYP